jgi:hypothetical protein
VVSVLAALVFYRGIAAVGLTVPWWVDAPSVMGLYGILYGVFDRWGWRLRILRKMRLINVPDLNGRWSGPGRSSFDDHGTDYEVTMDIIQTWTRLLVTLRTPESRSESLSATILTENPWTIPLSYEYLNHPRPNAKTTMNSHRGAAKLELQERPHDRVLDGDYCSGRGRVNFGALSVSQPQEVAKTG